MFVSLAVITVVVVQDGHASKRAIGVEGTSSRGTAVEYEEVVAKQV